MVVECQPYGTLYHILHSKTQETSWKKKENLRSGTWREVLSSGPDRAIGSMNSKAVVTCRRQDLSIFHHKCRGGLIGPILP